MLSQGENNQDQKEVVEYEIWILFQVALSNAGVGFGDLALTLSKPRMATITCTEECHFATLNK
jgi:hypothetical protein